MLFHQASDLLKPGSGYLVEVVNDLKLEGLIDKFGVSVYYSDEFEKVFQILKPDIVQLPVSLFDQRFYKDGTIPSLSRQNVEIHSRSMFLQGLPLLLPESLPDILSHGRNSSKTLQMIVKLKTFHQLLFVLVLLVL